MLCILLGFGILSILLVDEFFILREGFMQLFMLFILFEICS